MSLENVYKFFRQALIDPDLNLKIQRAKYKYKNANISEEISGEFITKKILPLGRQIKLEFTKENVEEYIKNQKHNLLSDDDLECVAGGSSKKKCMLTIGGISMMPLIPFYNGNVLAQQINNVNPVSYSTKISTDISEDYKIKTFIELKVEAGDTLWLLALKFMGDGDKYTEIMSINSLGDSNIYVGQILKIPVDIKILEFRNQGFNVRLSDNKDYELYEYNSDNSHVDIPDGIVYIGNEVFNGKKYIKSVSIPKSVKKIKEYAFKDCTELEHINFSNGLECINSAFEGCSSLKELQLPPSLINMDGAFNGCSSLVKITIPKCVTEIGYQTFKKCFLLEEVCIQGNLKTISSNSFELCTSLKTISLPNSLKFIRAGAFRGCTSLDNIIIPSSVTDISGAFIGCSGLKNIEIKANLSSIGFDTFAGCTSLEEIVLPKSLKIIDVNAFGGCRNLKNANIPNSVRGIGQGAFNGCVLLEVENMPSSIRDIGSYAFYKCENIKTVKISKSTSIGKYAFPDNCEVERVNSTNSLKISSYMEQAHNFICDCIDLEKNTGNSFKNCFKLVGDGIANILNKYDKFSELPKVLNEAEFNEISKNKTVLYRGIKDFLDFTEDGTEIHMSALDMADKFRYGEFFNGNGIFGNGTYTASDLTTAKGYTNDNDEPVIIKMVLEDNANIIEYDDLEEIGEHYKFEHIEYNNIAKSNDNEYEYRIKRLSDLGNLAETLNYDAIHVGSECTGECDYYIILNRGKIIVCGENVSYDTIKAS